MKKLSLLLLALGLSINVAKAQMNLKCAIGFEYGKTTSESVDSKMYEGWEDNFLPAHGGKPEKENNFMNKAPVFILEVAPSYKINKFEISTPVKFNIMNDIEIETYVLPWWDRVPVSTTFLKHQMFITGINVGYEVKKELYIGLSYDFQNATIYREDFKGIDKIGAENGYESINKTTLGIVPLHRISAFIETSEYEGACASANLYVDFINEKYVSVGVGFQIGGFLFKSKKKKK
jgi:hypothetical protein